MKHKTLSLLFSVLAFISVAGAQTQLPNLGFEKWSENLNMDVLIEAPTGWEVGEICASMGEDAECSIGAIKSTEAYEGDYAVKITNEGMLGLNILDMEIDQKPDAIALYLNMKGFNADSTTIMLAGLLHSKSFFDDDKVIVQEAIKEYTTKEFADGYHKVVIPFVDTEDGDPTADFEYLTLLFVINDADEDDISSALIDNIVLVYNGKSEVSEIENQGSTGTIENPVDEEIRLMSTELYINDEGFYPEERFEFAYNDLGQIETATWLDPLAFGRWEELYVDNYTYNANGKLVFSESLSENELDDNGKSVDPSNYQRSFWFSLIYNGNGDESKLESIVQNADWDSGIIYKDTTTITYTYIYDADGNITSKTAERVKRAYNEDPDTSQSITTMTYDDNGLLVSEIYTNYSGSSYKSEYTYNSSDLLEICNHCLFINDECKDDGSITYTYDANGNVIEVLSISINDVDTKDVFEYDLSQENIFTDYDREFLYNDVDYDFVPGLEVTFSNLLMKSVHYERWDENDEWTKYAFLNYEYSGLDNNEEENGTETKTQVTNQPITVEYRNGNLVSTDASANVTYQIFTANGTLISQGEFNGTQSVSQLSTGMYVAQTSSNNSFCTITFIVQ